MSSSSLDFHDSLDYSRQSGGTAIASVIFYQYNPSGRLQITIYPASYINNLSLFDMNHQYTGSTSVSYSIESLMRNNSDEVNVCMQSFRVNITNASMRYGNDVVLVFITPPQVLHDDQTLV